MNPVSVDIKDLLVTAGLGTFAATTGWGIYISSEPETPDKVITVYDTGGTMQGVYDKTVKPLRFEDFQVRVRAATYDAAWDRIQEVINSLNQKAVFTVVVAGENDAHYAGIIIRSGPQSLKKDESDRHIFVADFRAFRNEVT